MRIGRSIGNGVGLVLLALFAGACGELTSGGVGTGEAEVFVTGDGGDDAPAAAGLASHDAAGLVGGAAGTPRSPAGAVISEAAVDGTVGAELRVWLSDADGRWFELTDGMQTVEVAADGSTEARLAAEILPAGRYPRVRAAFARAEADVRSGLVIGGLPVVGQVRVGIDPADSVVVEREVDLTILEGGRVALVVDLNAPVWLGAASVADRVVLAADFAGAVSVRVR